MPAVTPIPFEDFAREVLADYTARQPRTRAKLSQVLRQFAAATAPGTTAGLTTAAVARFAAARPALSPNTVLGYLGYLRTACRVAVERGWLDREPAWQRCRPRPAAMSRNPVLSLEQLRRLLALTAGRGASWEGGRLHCLAVTVALTGLRRDEALHLRWEEVDLATGTLGLSEGTGRPRLKTLAAARVVPLGPEPRAALADWRVRCDAPWVFPGVRRRGPWTGGSAADRPLGRLQEAARSAGVGRVTWHGLRHTWATLALTEWSVPLWVVSRVLGHGSIRTTERYLHASGLDQARAALESARVGF